MVGDPEELLQLLGLDNRISNETPAAARRFPLRLPRGFRRGFRKNFHVVVPTDLVVDEEQSKMKFVDTEAQYNQSSKVTR